MVRNTIFTTWQSAAVSAPNSSVRSLPVRHRVAMTFDADEAVAEVWRGIRHAGSSVTMFSAYIGLKCPSDTEVPREPARESEQSIGLLVVCASGSWRALLQCGTLDGVVYQLSRGARRLSAARGWPR